MYRWNMISLTKGREEWQYLPYKIDQTVSVVPMYHPETKSVTEFFFVAPDKAQIWRDTCPSPCCAIM